MQSRMELEMDLRDALENDEFFLVYQPTFNLRDMSPTGMEALIRWKQPDTGDRAAQRLHSPARGDGADRRGRKWVLQEACRQGAKWREDGHEIGMAVNVSARQLDTDEFVIDVQEALAESGWSPSR